MNHSEYNSEESYALQFHQRASGVPKHWILLDTGSTVESFRNPIILKGIHEVEETMDVHCNVGNVSMNIMGTFPGYGEVWYCKSGIANILSPKNIKQQFRIMYDSADKEYFMVHKPDQLLMFNESPKGLYYHRMKKREVMLLNNGSLEDEKVSNVRHNANGFTKQDYK
uniref:Uncharacterized protein n=1 Tax=Odontella aurita TaxID=265563 RepID=A0A7S4M6B3_9STRA|mmetsp:Transcript_1202/g.3230  ORF Transcript_1202/g.3230 Transcript_1202/m.3230 type:complete len:168 (+) Transcript_1202:367-870(+)